MDNETNINAETSRNAVSVYRADGPMDDFPVLKAFQQYIDAEQNKARKRLVTLCVFFGAMICVVIAVFMVMLHDISQRNQQLNDRLVEYAMKDRDRVPVFAAPQPVIQTAAPANGAATEAALKAITDTLVALQKQIAERRDHDAVRAPATQAQAAAPAATAPAAVDEAEIERKERMARERIRKERAQLAEERRKFAEERERKHQEEVERHRRRLYPEYYAAQDNAAAGATQQPDNAAPAAVQPPPAQKPAAPQTQVKREISDDDIADILREANLSEEEEPAAPPAAPAQTAPKENDDVNDAIEYFSDDEYEIPVEVNGKSVKWRVPLD